MNRSRDSVISSYCRTLGNKNTYYEKLLLFINLMSLRPWTQFISAHMSVSALENRLLRFGYLDIGMPVHCNSNLKTENSLQSDARRSLSAHIDRVFRNMGNQHNGQWAMGNNGQWAMGDGRWAMGNGQWVMGTMAMGNIQWVPRHVVYTMLW